MVTTPGQRAKGKTAFHAGMAAEEIVARHYARNGHQVAAQRWRGTAGEIDLVVRDGEGLIFIEVKKAVSHEAAARQLSSRQMKRIYAAASEFLAGEPSGQMTNSRFDAALVDVTGQVSIIPNAWCA